MVGKALGTISNGHRIPAVDHRPNPFAFPGNVILVFTLDGLGQIIDQHVILSPTLQLAEVFIALYFLQLLLKFKL